MPHPHSIDRWQHSHVFLSKSHEKSERKTWVVIALTVTMMVAEIAAGTVLGSMALVADGWHMSTHAAALCISAVAYSYARRNKNNPHFAFGTGKLGDLAGFTSAIILGVIAALVVYEAVLRIMHPIPIIFGEAIGVACLGLTVNLVSAWLLRDDHHSHTHADDDAGDNHHHPAHHHDNNIRSAYIHVIADAATSVLAIFGLLAAWLYGLLWMDPVMGIIGALVIVSWASSLIKATGRVLLDVTPNKQLTQIIRQVLEANGDLVTDLHLWQIGPGHFGAIVSLIADDPKQPNVYKEQLSHLERLSHVTIEVQKCPDA